MLATFKIKSIPASWLKKASSDTDLMFRFYLPYVALAKCMSCHGIILGNEMMSHAIDAMHGVRPLLLQYRVTWKKNIFTAIFSCHIYYWFVWSWWLFWKVFQITCINLYIDSNNTYHWLICYKMTNQISWSISMRLEHFSDWPRLYWHSFDRGWRFCMLTLICLPKPSEWCSPVLDIMT